MAVHSYSPWIALACLLAPPLWLSIHCSGPCIASAALWSRHCYHPCTKYIVSRPSGAVPATVHCCHPYIASLVFCCCCPYGSPVQPPQHCFRCLLESPLWLSTVAAPALLCLLLQLPYGVAPTAVNNSGPCMHGFSCLLAPPLWLSTGVAPVIVSLAFWRRPWR
jgi:hypothetical protein